MKFLPLMAGVAFSALMVVGTASAEMKKKSHGGHSKSHWSYSGKTGPGHWADMKNAYGTCGAGLQQSPIDVVAAVEADLPSLQMTYGGFAPTVLNNGHAIQVNVPDGRYMEIGGDTYALLQFHFHTGSEYAIDGRSFPLEAHFVHKNAQGQLAVVGVMFKEGAKSEPLVEKLFAKLPSKKGGTQKIKEVVDITKLLPQDDRYYRFVGSLTTPPCTEGVQWYMMQEPLVISGADLERFRAVHPKNNRPIQPTNGRLIVKDVW